MIMRLIRVMDNAAVIVRDWSECLPGDNAVPEGKRRIIFAGD